MAGTRISRSPYKYTANNSALGSAAMYSSHPEESTTTASEALGMVTIIVFPLHPLSCAAQLLYGAGAMQANRSIEYIRLQLLPWLELELLPKPLWNHHLIFRRDLYHLHL